MTQSFPLLPLLRRTPRWLAAAAGPVLLYPIVVFAHGGAPPAPWQTLFLIYKLAVEGIALLWASRRRELPDRLSVSVRVLGFTSCLSAAEVAFFDLPNWTPWGVADVMSRSSYYASLFSYVLFFAGLSLYPRSGRGRTLLPAWLDVIATGAGLAVLQWTLMSSNLIASVEPGTTARLSVTLYSIAFILASAELNLVVVLGQRLPTARAFWWLVAGLAAYVPVTFLAQFELAGYTRHLWTSIVYFWGLGPTLIAAVLMRHEVMRTPSATSRELSWMHTFNPLPLWTLLANGVYLVVAVYRGDAKFTMLLSISVVMLSAPLGLRLVLATREYARAQRESAAAQQRAAAAKTDAIGRLAGGIAHEFNNLMTTVLGHAELTAFTRGTLARSGVDWRRLAERPSGQRS